jgi:hypothetical protein
MSLCYSTRKVYSSLPEFQLSTELTQLLHHLPTANSGILNPILCCNCQLLSLIFAELNSRLPILNWLNITTLHRFQHYPYCCVFTDPLLRNRFLYCCVHVHFRVNLFPVPLPSNELFRLSGVMFTILWHFAGSYVALLDITQKFILLHFMHVKNVLIYTFFYSIEFCPILSVSSGITTYRCRVS